MRKKVSAHLTELHRSLPLSTVGLACFGFPPGLWPLDGRLCFLLLLPVLLHLLLQGFKLGETFQKGKAAMARSP